MKWAAKQMSLDNVKFHVPDLHYAIDDGSDSPTTADQDIPTRPEAALHPDLKKVISNCHLCSTPPKFYFYLHWQY